MSHGTRRKCQQCRLKRCFAMGMKTDYFISEEEKQRRRKRLVDNLHLSPPCPPSIQVANKLFILILPKNNRNEKLNL